MLSRHIAIKEDDPRRFFGREISKVTDDWRTHIQFRLFSVCFSFPFRNVFKRTVAISCLMSLTCWATGVDPFVSRLVEILVVSRTIMYRGQMSVTGWKRRGLLTTGKRPATRSLSKLNMRIIHFGVRKRKSGTPNVKTWAVRVKSKVLTE